jgi:hypothetical protein
VSESSRSAELAAEVAEQRRTIQELQTPVIQVWERILALPIVGSLGTARTQEMNAGLELPFGRLGFEVVRRDGAAAAGPVGDLAAT